MILIIRSQLLDIITFKTSSFQSINIESETFTNRLAEFNMYKLIHKHIRVKPPSATLLDNIYTNIQTWLKPHNVDCFFIKGYSHKYSVIPNRIGGGVSFCISNRLMYSRRNYIQFNPLFKGIIIDIERSELNSIRIISIILVYRPPNTDSNIFINDFEIILSKLDSKNIFIFMIGDFNYDKFKTSSFQSINIESETFTNRLADFNMYKLIHKPTRINPPSATLLDNIYTNIKITIDNRQLSINVNQTQNYIRKRYFTGKIYS